MVSFAPWLPAEDGEVEGIDLGPTCTGLYHDQRSRRCEHRRCSPTSCKTEGLLQKGLLHEWQAGRSFAIHLCRLCTWPPTKRSQPLLCVCSFLMAMHIGWRKGHCHYIMSAADLLMSSIAESQTTQGRLEVAFKCWNREMLSRT